MHTSARVSGSAGGSAHRIPCRLGLAKAAAVSVPMLASTALTCVMGALLPPAPGLVLFTLGLMIACSLLVAALEPLAVRLLYGCVPLSVADQRVLSPTLATLCRHGLGPPLVDLWVRQIGPSISVVATGRRSVLVSRALLEAISSGTINAERATSLLAREAGLARAGANRSDLFLRFWTVPWVLLTRVMVGAAQGLGGAPIVRVAWRARWAVTAIAVVQAAAADHGLLAVLVLAIGATSYLWPRWVRAWQAQLAGIGNEAVSRVRAFAQPTGPGPVPRSDQRPAASEPCGGTRSPVRHLSVVR
jgi:hypothetical protein